jgi:hypothetical protein
MKNTQSAICCYHAQEVGNQALVEVVTCHLLLNVFCYLLKIVPFSILDCLFLAILECMNIVTSDAHRAEQARDNDVS